MAFNGSGLFVRLYNWVNDAAAGINIKADRSDAELDGIATGLSTCITKDGQTTTTAVIPFAAGMSATTGVFSSTLTPQALLDASGAAAGQIKFPATQNPSADANTLDDYEEGTFSPTFTFGGAAVGMTFSAQVGRYQKVGRDCTFQINLVLTAKGSSSGNVTLGGLPFTSTAAANAYVCYSVFGDVLTGISGGLMAYTAPSSTGINLRQSVTGTATVLTEANINNTSQIIIAGTYETA